MWDISKITEVNNIDFNTEVIYTSKFKSDYRLSDYQEEIDRLIDDIKNGYIYDNSPGNEADYTNCLVVESNNFQLTYEKRITSELTNDRLIYEVVKPNFKRGFTILTITVRLSSCLFHDRLSQRLNSNTEDYFDEVNTDDIYNPSLTELDW